jgi:hypothetical protein
MPQIIELIYMFLLYFFVVLQNMSIHSDLKGENDIKWTSKQLAKLCTMTIYEYQNYSLSLRTLVTVLNCR